MEENSTQVRLTSGANSSSTRFLETFFPLSCSALMNAMTSPQTSLSPFLLFYLIFAVHPHRCTHSKSFMYIHPKRSVGAVHPAHEALRWPENPTQLCNSLYEALKDVSSRSQPPPASTATNTALSLVPMSKAPLCTHRQYDSGAENHRASQMQPEPRPQLFHCTIFCRIAWYILQEEQSRYENVAKWSADLMISIIRC